MFELFLCFLFHLSSTLGFGFLTLMKFGDRQKSSRITKREIKASS